MSSKKIVLADSLSHLGGAEKTLKNYSDQIHTKEDVVYIDTEKLSPYHLHQYSNSHWILGNFWQLINRGLLDIFRERVKKYSVFNFDYLFCPNRNLEYHKHLTGIEFKYDLYSKNVDKFLASAENLFFMSEVQKLKYLNFLKFIKEDNCTTLGSLISTDDIELIKNHWDCEKNENYCIYHQNTWQKGLKESIDFCEKDGIPYEILPKLNYEEFIENLSKYKGLVFLPNGGDTAPRITIEAQLLGLDLIINENVEHHNETWFRAERDSIISHMDFIKNKFLEKINEI